MLKPSTHGTQASPHYALGLEAYAQATSPIRRYFDLCNQRQLLAHLRGEPTPYTAEQLEPLIHELDITLGTVRTIAFESKRYWLLKYLRQRMRDNPEITATVTRIDTKRPVVKLDEVFMTAMTALKGTPKYNDRVRLRLVEVDPRGDYLRLEHVG